MTHDTPATDALDDRLLRNRGISYGDVENETQGIKAFIMNFVASSCSNEVAPATRDFRKASSFLFRK